MCCMLLYHGDLQNWLDYGYNLMVFLILALFDFVKRVKFGVSGHFPENALWEWPDILFADVSWPLPEMISLWS